MDAPKEKRSSAWQPLTPRGVAAFARASLGRLLIVQLVCALIAAGAVAWFLHRDWFPVIDRAISQLPEQGGIGSGRLDWRGDAPVMLAEGRFLAISVDSNHSGNVRSPAHVQVEFGQRDYQVFSLLGYVRGHYRANWSIGLNREEMTPWWGAWAPAILAISVGGVVVGLVLCWALLSTAYFGIAWLIGFYTNRDLDLGGSWRLSGAAMMPGAVFLTSAIVLYGFGGMDLLPLMIAGAAHLVIGWAYLVASVLQLPPHPEVAGTRKNPFV